MGSVINTLNYNTTLGRNKVRNKVELRTKLWCTRGTKSQALYFILRSRVASTPHTPYPRPPTLTRVSRLGALAFSEDKPGSTLPAMYSSVRAVHPSASVSTDVRRLEETSRTCMRPKGEGEAVGGGWRWLDEVPSLT